MPKVLWALFAILLSGIGFIDACTDHTDIIYVVDANPNVNDRNHVNNWRDLMKTLRAVTLNIGKRAPGARFAFIRYARIGSVAFNLKTFERYQDAAEQILKLSPSYNDNAVNLHDGLTLVEVIMSLGATSGGIRATTVVVISDERPNIQSEIIVTQANRLAFVGVRIIAVALSPYADESALTRLISNQVRDFLRIPNYSELTQHEASLVNLVCLPFAAQIVACSQDADIVLVLDSSGSMTETNGNGWNMLKTFAVSLASNLASSPDRRYRFGYVKFSHEAIIEAPLQQYSSQFATKIISSSHMKWLTNHADALTKADIVLTNGGDDGRAKYIVIITDGIANVDAEEGPRVAQRIRDKNIGIVAVGVTETVNKEKLYELSGAAANTILAENFDQDLVGDLVTIINQLQTCPSSDRAPQGPPTVAACTGAPEIVIVLDASDSIDLKRLGGWEMVKEFASRLAGDIKQLVPEARFGLVKFGPSAVVETPLDGDINAVQRIIMASGYIGGVTNQAEGLRAARQLLVAVRQGAIKYVIMVTDGTPTDQVGQEFNVAKILREEGTRMIIIGVTSHRNEKNLFELAGTDGVVFQSDTYGGLTSMVSPVISATRACPPNLVPCNRAYVLFAIDQSESIEVKGAGNFERLKRFVIELARGLYQRYPDIQFALVSFSDQADVLRYFSDFKGDRKLEEFINAVSSMSYHNEMTNLAAALTKSREAIVKGVSGPAQVIIMTDGEPNMDVTDQLNEAKRLRDLGVQILALGVTREINRDTLEQITGDPRHVFLAPDFQSLTSNIEPLIVTSCEPGQPGAEIPNCLTSDIVFVLDASGSVNYSDWRSAKGLVKDIMVHLNRNNPAIRFGVVVFSSFAMLASDLSSDIQYVSSRLTDVLWIGQETNIYEGLRVTRNEGFQKSGSDRSKVTVLISDGYSNQYPRKEIEEARLLKGPPLSSTIAVVGVTDKVDFDVLRQVASKPEMVVGSPNFDTVRTQLEQIVNTVCIPQNSPSRDIPTCKVDLALIVDSSNSITEDQNDPLMENWNLIKQTLFSLVNSLGPRGPNGVQIALVTFSDEAYVRLRFNDSSNPRALNNAINNLENDGFLTNMADAFQVTRMDVFGYGKGTRMGVRKVALLITDGQPTIRESMTYAQATLLKAQLDYFKVVAVTENIAGETLTSIARPHPYIHVKDYFDLGRSLSQIAMWIC